MLVAIEGVDGMGKCTQANMLKARLNADNTLARVISFPRDDGPAGATIRGLLSGKYMMVDYLNVHAKTAELETIQALMLADRLAAGDLLRENGVVTICDRYIFSGIVYGAVDGLDEPWLYSMHKLLPQPDIQILLDANPEIAKLRRPVMRDRYERDFVKLHKIREKYLSIWREAASASLGKWFIVDASQDPDVVHANVVNCYNKAKLISEMGTV